MPTGKPANEIAVGAPKEGMHGLPRRLLQHVQYQDLGDRLVVLHAVEPQQQPVTVLCSDAPADSTHDLAPVVDCYVRTLLPK
ncbi:hypothetical protein [Streptomyces sp. NPDC088748]|uniref:hypothetical protein n=1 Tax=Streptomyces sp. NPDC088748 TaxID=3365887 RepID=UPI003820A0CB